MGRLALIWGLPLCVALAVAWGTKPPTMAAPTLTVQAIAIDDDWLFLYPEKRVAALNTLAIPAGQSVALQVTSETHLTTLRLPEVRTQVLAVPGGFTETTFNAPDPMNAQGVVLIKSLPTVDFDSWVAAAYASPLVMDGEVFAELQSQNTQHLVFDLVDTELWTKVVNRCHQSGALCQHTIHLADALGGGGVDGLFTRQLVEGICSADDISPLLALVPNEKHALGPRIQAILSDVSK